jgi:hypothetical protein
VDSLDEDDDPTPANAKSRKLSSGIFDLLSNGGDNPGPASGKKSNVVLLSDQDDDSDSDEFNDLSESSSEDEFGDDTQDVSICID